MLGGSFAAVTVSTKLLRAARPSASRTVKVIVADPVRLAAGVMMAVRLLPLPPNWMLAFGRRYGFEELAETVRALAGVSRSPTVKAIFVWPSSAMVRLAMAEMVGE